MKRHILLLLTITAGFCSFGQDFSDQLCKSAIELTKQEVIYDPSYFSIDYPNGDVPDDVGVCTDVVIRAYRKLGIDLQLPAGVNVAPTEPLGLVILSFRAKKPSIISVL